MKVILRKGNGSYFLAELLGRRGPLVEDSSRGNMGVRRRLTSWNAASYSSSVMARSNPSEVDNRSARARIPPLHDIYRINANLVRIAQDDPRFEYDPEGKLIYDVKLGAIYENFPVRSSLYSQMAYLFRAIVWAQAFPYANKRTGVATLKLFIDRVQWTRRENSMEEMRLMAKFLHHQFRKVPMDQFNDYFEPLTKNATRISMKINHIVDMGEDPLLTESGLPEIEKWLKQKIVYSDDILMNMASNSGHDASHHASNSSFVIGKHNPSRVFNPSEPTIGKECQVEHPPTKGTYQLPVDRTVAEWVSNRYSIAHRDKMACSLDLKVPTGSPVFAARGGVVWDFYEEGDRGGVGPKSKLNPFENWLEIKHTNADGSEEFSEYGHLKKGSISASGVHLGDHVEQGDVVAESGATGWLYKLGPHLHFEVLRYTGPKDSDYATLQVRWREGTRWPPSYEPVRGNPQVRVPEEAMRRFTGDFIRQTWAEIVAEARRKGWDHDGREEEYYGYVDTLADMARSWAKVEPPWAVGGLLLHKMFIVQPFDNCNRRTGFNSASAVMKWAGYPQKASDEVVNIYLGNLDKRRLVNDELTLPEAIGWIKHVFGA